MTRKLFILIGGSDAQNGDYSGVLRLARSGGTANWSSLKTACPGDRVLIYIRQPPGALVVKAEVLAEPVKGKPGDYAYRAKVGKFELLPNQLEIGDLKRAFPSWDWLRFPRRGIAVPHNIADRLWKLIHEKQSRVQILISNSGYGLRLLEKLDKSGRTVYWAAPKLTQPGDTVLFYVIEPVSAIVAVGKALSETRSTNRKWYEAKIGEIRKLESQISLKELRKMFPRWVWLKHVIMFSYVSPERAKALVDRCKLEVPVLPNSQWPGAGAGFGNAETNRLVEKAAVGRVARLLRKCGFKVVSREKDRIGYDLDATKGQIELHVEVKGVSGEGIQFPITSAEVRRSEVDKQFRLMVVTSARMRHAKVHEFRGAQLKRMFQLSPLSFMAVKRD